MKTYFIGQQYNLDVAQFNEYLKSSDFKICIKTLPGGEVLLDDCVINAAVAGFNAWKKTGAHLSTDKAKEYTPQSSTEKYLGSRMKVKLLDGETLIKEGAANYFNTLAGVGGAAAGGRLYLTNKRILFEGHRFNIGRKFVVIYVDEIISCSTGFLNTLTLLNNRNEEYAFAVSGKKTGRAKQKILSDNNGITANGSTVVIEKEQMLILMKKVY